MTLNSLDCGVKVVIHNVLITGKLIEEVYSEWEPNEPNNSGDGENCVIFTKVGLINDMNCNNRIPFLCKKPMSSVEWNALCEVPDQSKFYSN